MKTHWQLLFGILMITMMAVGCSTQEVSQKNAAPSPSKNAAPHAPKVKEGASQLMFSWFEGNDAKTTMDMAKVPDNVKKEVRVQDLAIPPDKRDPSWIFLADLTQKQNDGSYKVRVVQRDKYEEKRHPVQKVSLAEAGGGAAAVTGENSVIMYATPHCPHCKRARRWLLAQKIPYREVNLEEDAAAAAELAQKGQAQGVPTSGVPMFEINGRLIPGFDPAAIQKALTLPPLGAAPGQMPGIQPAPNGSGNPPTVEPPKPTSPSTMTI